MAKTKNNVLSYSNIYLPENITIKVNERLNQWITYSRDSNELVPPADSKMALHYFRYVQAARDGQESKNCLDIYAKCNIDYNKK